jgi:hypothetical protein
MFEMTKEAGGGVYMRWMMHEVAAVGMLGSFSSDSQWFGEAIPDMAFAQLKVRATPHLKLADDEYYIRPGTPIATAGFPLGNVPMTIMKKVNQAAPFIRRGIVSSVFPFSIPKPHGFTIDIMQQGGVERFADLLRGRADRGRDDGVGHPGNRECRERGCRTKGRHQHEHKHRTFFTHDKAGARHIPGIAVSHRSVAVPNPRRVEGIPYPETGSRLGPIPDLSGP